MTMDNNNGKDGTAEAAATELHNAIMNLPCKTYEAWGCIAVNSYKAGHRDARRAAAEMFAANVSMLLAATVATPATAAKVPDYRLRSRVADLLHLLQFAKISTPSEGDAEQAEKAMADVRTMLAVAQTPTAAPAEPAPILSSLDIGKIIQLHDENTDRDYGLLIEPFARAIEHEVLARLSKPGAQSPAGMNEREAFIWNMGRAAGSEPDAIADVPTVLDIMSLIREQGHRQFLAGSNKEQPDGKYMAEIEAGIRQLARMSSWPKIIKYIDAYIASQAHAERDAVLEKVHALLSEQQCREINSDENQEGYISLSIAMGKVSALKGLPAAAHAAPELTDAQIARLEKLERFISNPGSIYFDYATDLRAIIAATKKANNE